MVFYTSIMMSRRGTAGRRSRQETARETSAGSTVHCLWCRLRADQAQTRASDGASIRHCALGAKWYTARRPMFFMRHIFTNRTDTLRCGATPGCSERGRSGLCSSDGSQSFRRYWRSQSVSETRIEYRAQAQSRQWLRISLGLTSPGIRPVILMRISMLAKPFSCSWAAESPSSGQRRYAIPVQASVSAVSQRQ